MHLFHRIGIIVTTNNINSKLLKNYVIIFSGNLLLLIISLNSIDLELLSRGKAKISTSEALFQKIVIEKPSPQSKVFGLSIPVSGKLHPNIVNIIRIELIGINGITLGHRIGNIVDRSGDGYNSFFAEVPYFATEIQQAILIVYEDGNNLSAIKHLSSVELLLSP